MINTLLSSCKHHDITPGTVQNNTRHGPQPTFVLFYINTNPFFRQYFFLALRPVYFGLLVTLRGL